MAVQKDISFYRGNDVTYTLNDAEDITGWQITFTVRLKAADPDPALILKTVSGGGITIDDGPNGIYTVIIADTDTEGMNAGSYDYDIKRTDPGAEGTLVVGTLILKQEVTR